MLLPALLAAGLLLPADGVAGAQNRTPWPDRLPGLSPFFAQATGTPAGNAPAGEGKDWASVLRVIEQLDVIQWIYFAFSLLGAWLLGCFFAWLLGAPLNVRPAVAARIGLVLGLVAFGFYVPLVFFPYLVKVGLPLLGIVALSGIVAILAIILLLGLFVS